MKKLLLKLIAVAAILLPVIYLSPSAAAIDCSNPQTAQQSIQCGANGASGQNSQNQTVSDASTQASSSLHTTVTNILNIFSAAVGIIAVIMIVVGGFRYVTSGGKQESVSAAKSTIMYAVIGLVIVALAQTMVHFVLNNVASPECVNGQWDSGPSQGKSC